MTGLEDMHAFIEQICVLQRMTLIQHHVPRKLWAGLEPKASMQEFAEWMRDGKPTIARRLPIRWSYQQPRKAVQLRGGTMRI